MNNNKIKNKILLESVLYQSAKQLTLLFVPISKDILIIRVFVY